MRSSRVPIHSCQIRDDGEGFEKLAPNAPVWRNIFRKIRTFTTVNVDAAICKRNYRNRSQIAAEKRRHVQSRYFYMVHPYSSMERWREFLFIIVWGYEMISTPIHASFGLIFRKNKLFQSVFAPYIERSILLPAELSLILLLFFTGYKEASSKVIVLSHFKVFKRYMLTYFVFDALTLTLPIQNEIYIKFVHLTNLACFARIKTLMGCLHRFTLDLKINDHIFTCVDLILTTFLMLNFFTCLFFYVPHLTTRKPSLRNLPIWLTKANIANVDLTEAYLGCFSLVQIHFFGLGEGSVKSKNDTEKCVLVIVMIIGRLWTLYMIASLLRMLSVVYVSECKYEEYLLQLETFMRQKGLPKDLRTRLIEYYEYKYQHHFFNEQEIFSTLSAYIKNELILFNARKLISKVEIFKALPKSVVGGIIFKCRQMVFLANDMIVKSGDSVEHLYFINSGTCAIFSRRGIELAHIHDGDEIGLRGMVINSEQSNHMFNYVATETTEVYMIAKKDFRAIIYDKRDVLKFFATRVDDRLKLFEKIELTSITQGIDLLSELGSGKIIEQPRIRTRHFEK